MTPTNAAPRIIRRDQDGVAVLTIDYPGRSLNVVDESVFGELRTHVGDIAADQTVRAVVLASGKPASFGAGADVEWLPELVARPDADAFLASVHALMHDMVASSKPFVAAVHGVALGGALEVVLGTHAIVATPEARLGLPEITLGLMPGGAGTQLLRRFVPTAAALDLLLGGRPLEAANAQRSGLVAEVVPAAGLLDAAVALAQRLAAGDAAVPRATETVAEATAALDARAGGATGAAAAILDAVRAGVEGGWDEGCRVERERFIALVTSPEAQARIHLFQAEGAIKRRSRGSGAAPATIGVVGGGQMGSGIAATAVLRGLTAVVHDIGADQLVRSRDYLDRVLARSAADRAGELASRWASTTQWEGFGAAEAVIEAVFELPEVKLETLARAAERVSETTLIATNTSAIPVRTLAPAVPCPERFLGMHFFSPVERMPLVELVPHTQTSEETVARAAGLAGSLGKLPVVVADAPGFFTSRVYARWLIEGIRLLLDGVEPERIESAAKAAGFPVGPLQAHDEASLDLVVKASITQVAERVMADRIDVAGARRALESLIAGGVEGRRAGTGFYLYEDGRRSGMNPAVPRLLGRPETPLDDQTVRDRLLLAFATECLLCWDDGTICHPDDGDVAAVLGIGFPRALGGPFHWADAVGAEWLVKRSAELGSQAFPVGERVPSFAASGGRFANEPRLPVPGRAAQEAEASSPSGR